MPKTDVLVPCPNPECGCDNLAHHSEAHEPTFDDDYWITCLNCELRGPMGNDRGDAARLWNALPRSGSKTDVLVSREAVLKKVERFRSSADPKTVAYHQLCEAIRALPPASAGEGMREALADDLQQISLIADACDRQGFHDYACAPVVVRRLRNVRDWYRATLSAAGEEK